MNEESMQGCGVFFWSFGCHSQYDNSYGQMSESLHFFFGFVRAIVPCLICQVKFLLTKDLAVSVHKSGSISFASGLQVGRFRHDVFGGIRCDVIESGVVAERDAFLASL